MIDSYKKQAVMNLKKTRGQIDRVFAMIEEGKYCIDVAQQVNAAIGLLKKTNNYILESHLLTCGAQNLGLKNARKKKEFVQELIRVCNMANRF